MNFIEKIVENYNGEYTEEPIKRFNWIGGKITYQPKSGLIEVDGSKLKVSFKEAGGVMKSTDPIRIVLFLDKDYNARLSVYPSLVLNYFSDIIWQPKSLNIPKSIKKQFSFRGNYDLIKKLASDELFCETILNEEIYITLDNRFPKSLMVTPAYGIYDMEHFQKLVLIAKRIEFNIKN